MEFVMKMKADAVIVGTGVGGSVPKGMVYIPFFFSISS